LNIADGVTTANTQALGYDLLDHLTGATGAYGSLGYSYSPIGNRLTQTSAGVLSTYTDAPHSNQLAAITTGTATQTLGTTASGNVNSFAPALGTVTGLTYNQANRLAAASAGTHTLAQYTYDGFGQRLVKLGSITATTLYQYDLAGHLLEENDGAGHARVDYVYLGDRPIATIQPSNGKVYFLHDDRLGTPQLATDAGQAVQWSASYQPFGSTSTGVGLIVQNLRLPGQEFDLETGLYHNGFRDYAPQLGRYLESDPIGLAGGANTYSYVGGNPFKWTDIHGLCYCESLDKAVADTKNNLYDYQTQTWRWNDPGALKYDLNMAELSLEEDSYLSHLSYAVGAGLEVGAFQSSSLASWLASKVGGIAALALGGVGELSSIDEDQRQKEINALNARLNQINAETAGLCGPSN
jgi:RHS repeat-associated protein